MRRAWAVALSFTLGAVAAGSARPALAQEVTRVALVRDSSVVLTTRVCRIYDSGALYCQNVDEALARQWGVADLAQFRAALAGIYKAHGLNPAHNGLMSCGASTWAAAPQSTEAAPGAGDVKQALDACATQLGAKMPARGVGGAMGALQGVTVGGRGDGPGMGGTRCSSGGANPLVGRPKPGGAQQGRGGGTTVVLRDNEIPSVVTGRTELEERVESDHRDANKNREKFPAIPPTTYTDLAKDYRAAAASAEKDGDKDGAARLKQLAAEAEKRAKEEGEQATQGTRDESGGVKQVGPDGDACSEAEKALADLARECDRNANSSYECMKLQSCGDPAVTMPADGQTAVTCGPVTIFGGDELLRAALLKKCQAVRTTDPSVNCTGQQAPGGTLADVKRLCISPYALVTESCLESMGAQVTFMTLQRDVATVLGDACARVGGPACTAPSGGTGPGGPIGPRAGAAPAVRAAPSTPVRRGAPTMSAPARLPDR